MVTRAKSFLFTNKTPGTNVPKPAAYQMRGEGKKRKSVSPLVSDWERKKFHFVCLGLKYLQHSTMSMNKQDLIFNHDKNRTIMLRLLLNLR